MAMNRRTFVVHSSLATLGTFLYSCSAQTKINIGKDTVIGCLGDSITATHPRGYVDYLQELTDQIHPEQQLTFLNWGKSSETITGLTEEEHPGPRPYLFERLDTLLKDTKVNVLFFCYGMNCGIYGKPSSTLFNSYKIGVYTFLEKIKTKGIKAIILTPPPLALVAFPLIASSSDRPYSYRNPYPKYEEEVLAQFRTILNGIEHSHLLGVLDIHTVLKEQQEKIYTQDPIHPNELGHHLIAETIIGQLAF
jgi:lysophospholipase L1-like esterase